MEGRGIVICPLGVAVGQGSRHGHRDRSRRRGGYQNSRLAVASNNKPKGNDNNNGHGGDGAAAHLKIIPSLPAGSSWPPYIKP